MWGQNSSSGLGDTSRMGSPIGGYVYVYKERKVGWYEWCINYLDDEPAYTCISEQDMGWTCAGGGEYMVIFHGDVNAYYLSDLEDMLVMDSSFMRNDDN